MTALLKAKIVDTEVEAEYQSNVYERTVLIKPDEVEIAVFEGANIITDADRGSTVGLELRAHLLQDMETVSETDSPFGISQNANRESKWSATVTGQLVSTSGGDWTGNQNSPTAVMDVGFGTISVEIDDADIRAKGMKNDDVVQIDCGRIDIIERCN